MKPLWHNTVDGNIQGLLFTPFLHHLKTRMKAFSIPWVSLRSAPFAQNITGYLLLRLLCHSMWVFSYKGDANENVPKFPCLLSFRFDWSFGFDTREKLILLLLLLFLLLLLLHPIGKRCWPWPTTKRTPKWEKEERRFPHSLMIKSLWLFFLGI